MSNESKSELDLKANEVVDEISNLIDLKINEAQQLGTEKVAERRRDLIVTSKDLLSLKIKTMLMMSSNKLLEGLKKIL